MQVEIQFADGIIEFRDISRRRDEVLPKVWVTARHESTPRYGNVRLRLKDESGSHPVYVEVTD